MPDDRFDVDVGDRGGEVEEYRTPRPSHLERAKAELDADPAVARREYLSDIKRDVMADMDRNDVFRQARGLPARSTFR